MKYFHTLRRHHTIFYDFMLYRRYFIPLIMITLKNKQDCKLNGNNQKANDTIKLSNTLYTTQSINSNCRTTFSYSSGLVNQISLLKVGVRLTRESHILEMSLPTQSSLSKMASEVPGQVVWPNPEPHLPIDGVKDNFPALFFQEIGLTAPLSQFWRFSSKISVIE